jgi:cell division transport system permease protein
MAEPPEERTARRAWNAAARAERRRARFLRPARFDDLGLKQALSDWLLPMLVAAMTFLAALALAGFVAAQDLGVRWRAGAGSNLVVQVPQPGAPAADGRSTRRQAVLDALSAAPQLASVHPLSEGDLADLLRPWLGSEGDALSVPLPAVLEIKLSAGAAMPPALIDSIQTQAPGTLIEDRNRWAVRLELLANSLQACTGLALLVVCAIASSVVALATRAGIAARREAIRIVHLLGATDAYIAGRFARRFLLLALRGGIIGTLAALPVLLALAALAAPFGLPSDAASPPGAADLLSALPHAIWIALPCLPMGAAALGWGTAQLTVLTWLRRRT